MQYPVGLAINRLTHTYPKSAPTFTDLSLTLEAGEFTTLLGSSGSGKTTLLRCIAGLEPYNSGSITWQGRPLAPGDISYVFQKPVLYPHLTVQDNILFSTRLKAFPGAIDEDHYRFLLSLLKLEGLEKRRTSQLSGGQAQRVGIARALVRKSPLILFDEPLSSVDESLSASICQDLIHLHQELGFTALYITHNQDEALQLGSRVAVMDGGQIAQCSAPAELLKNPRTLAVARLTGAPGFNLLDGVLEEQAVQLGFRATSPVLGAYSGLPLTVEVAGARILTGGVLYSAQTRGEHSWRLAGASRISFAAGQEITFVLPLDAAPLAKGQQRLCLAPEWCFVFDPKTGRRIINL